MHVATVWPWGTCFSQGLPVKGREKERDNWIKEEKKRAWKQSEFNQRENCRAKGGRRLGEVWSACYGDDEYGWLECTCPLFCREWRRDRNKNRWQGRNINYKFWLLNLETFDGNIAKEPTFEADYAKTKVALPTKTFQLLCFPYSVWVFRLCASWSDDFSLTLVSLSLFSWSIALAQMKIKIPMPMVKGPSIFILSEWRCCSRNRIRALSVSLEGVPKTTKQRDEPWEEQTFASRFLVTLLHLAHCGSHWLHPFLSWLQFFLQWVWLYCEASNLASPCKSLWPRWLVPEGGKTQMQSRDGVYLAPLRHRCASSSS